MSRSHRIISILVLIPLKIQDTWTFHPCARLYMLHLKLCFCLSHCGCRMQLCKGHSHRSQESQGFQRWVLGILSLYFIFLWNDLPWKIPLSTALFLPTSNMFGLISLIVISTGNPIELNISAFLTSDNLLFSFIMNPKWNIPCPSSDVNYFKWLFCSYTFIILNFPESHRTYHVNELVLPAPMHTKTHRVVHKVVAFSDTAEDLTH